MSQEISRRRFLSQISLAATALPLAVFSSNALAAVLAQNGIKLGYSAITWEGNDMQAIKEIAALGFTGIQLRANAYQEYGQKPAELKKILDDAKLELAMLSSGNANINTGNDEGEIKKHVEHAKFVKALGGKYIQVTNSSRPKTGTPTQEDLVKYGKLLTEVGKRTQAVGIQTAYHNHMHQLGETPEEVDVIMQTVDPKYVSLLLDIGHYHQGGGDPAKAIRQYKSQLKALHIKDVRDKNAIDPKRPYQFVELGQGKVNLPQVFAALKEIKFNGYAIVELDAVPEKGRTPLESGQIGRDYLKNQLKFSI